jgi:hypothetical protein
MVNWIRTKAAEEPGISPGFGKGMWNSYFRETGHRFCDDYFYLVMASFLPIQKQMLLQKKTQTTQITAFL